MHQILGTELFIIFKSGDWPVIYHATFIKTNQYYNYVYNQLYQDIREAETLLNDESKPHWAGLSDCFYEINKKISSFFYDLPKGVYIASATHQHLGNTFLNIIWLTGCLGP